MSSNRRVQAMHCGTATGFGWLHIEKEHYGQWQELLDDCNAVGGCGWGFAWDDIMDLATGSSLEAATQVVHRAVNSTVCYSVPFHLVNQQTGQVARTVYTRTVISANRAGTDADPQRIITSFFVTSSAGCYA